MGFLRDMVNTFTSPWALLFPPTYIAAWSIKSFLPPDIEMPGRPAPELQLTQNTVGALIPDLLGTVKMNGTLLFYGNEYYIKRGSKEKRRYWYLMTWGIGFGKGEVDSVYTFFSDEKVLWSGVLNKPVSGGKQSITGLNGFTTSGYHSGSIDVYFGTNDQVADASIGTMNGDATLNSPYRGLFYVVFKNCIIGVDSKRMPNITVVARKAPVYAFNAKEVVDIYDYNPMHAIWHMMITLVGLPSTWLDTTDFSNVADVMGGNEGDAWELKAPNPITPTSSQTNNLCVFNNKLYTGSLLNGKLYEWNGVDTWVEVAPKNGAGADGIKSLCVFNGKLYGGTGGTNIGRLLEWNGVDTWVEVAPTLSSNQIYVMLVFDSELYAGTSGGMLYKWNGVNAWIQVAASLPGYLEIYSLVEFSETLYGGDGWGDLREFTGTSWTIVAPRLSTYNYIYALIVYNGYLYGSSRRGQLLQWNGVDTWVEVAPAYLAGENYCYNIAIFHNKIYRGEYSGKLLEWNDIDAWVEVAPAYSSPHTYITSLVVYDSSLYGISIVGGLLKWNYAEGLGISMLLGDQEPAISYIQTILQHIDCILRFESNGKFHPKLIRNDYDTGTLSLIDEDTLLEPPVFKRKHWIDTLNEIKVQYSLLDRNADVIDLRQSTADPVAVDMGNYGVQGRTVSKTIQYALFTTNKNATWAARKDLQKASYPLAVLSMKVNRNLFQLQPGGCFKFSYVPNGISNMICRVLNASEEEFESEDITIEAIEDFFSIASAITEYTDPAAASVVLPDYTIAYFAYQKVMETPYDLVDDPAIIEVLPVACPASSLYNGFEFDISNDGGASYTMIDDMENLVPCGLLVGVYPANTLTIDDEYGFTIDFEYGEFQIASCSFSQALSGAMNVALLGDEIIFFQTITLVSGTQYKIDTVIRGRMDTVKQAHANNTVFYFLGVMSESLTHTSLIAEASRDFKLMPYNDLFYGTVAGATNINLAITGRAQTPYPPVNLIANDEAISPEYAGDVVLEWSPRKRGAGAGTGIPGTVLPDGTHEGYFKVEIWVSGVLKRTTTAIDADTWTYTSSMNTTDNGSLASSVTCKVSNYQTVDSVTYESDQAEIICTLQ